MIVDLHIHTYFSDGTMSVEEVVAKAKENNVKVISITDHNHLDSWQTLEVAAKMEGIHYLFDRGITQKLFDGFKLYKEYGCDFSEYEFPNLKKLCRAIREANGYSILAHPGEYYKSLDQEELMSVLEKLKIEGIQGIECYYPTHSQMMTDTCIAFCKNNNLLITSGSDEHGEFGKHAKTLEQTIGCMKIGIEKLNIKELL